MVAVDGSGFEGAGGEEAIHQGAESGGTGAEDVFGVAEEGLDLPDAALIQGELGGVFVAQGEGFGVEVKIGIEEQLEIEVGIFAEEAPVLGVEAAVAEGGLALEDAGRGEGVGQDGDELSRGRVRGEAEVALRDIKTTPALFGGGVLGEDAHTPIESGDGMGMQAGEGTGEEIGEPGIVAIEEGDVVGLGEAKTMIASGARAGIGLGD